MILYEVTAELDATIAAEFERYMVEKHVPDLLATGCFTGARVCRAGGERLRMTYEAPDEAALRRYLDQFAPALRAEVLERFPTGLALSREEWTELRSY